ncbi:MAG TPA: SIMPL domain-containing protein [Asticcacaulis sp.]|nr:SIMPL domain-containing protein [Asticcacaulis sp.]
MSRSFVKPALLALAVAAAPFAFAPAALAQAAAPAPTTLSLSATGTETAAPDMATISFAVVTQAATASEAMKANATQMNAVMASLKKAGIDKSDIQTSSLNLNPQYDYQNGQAPKLTGYQAQNQINVRVNDTTRTGPVVDAVIAAGVNQISNIDFGLRDDSAVRDQARKDAVAMLMQRAKLYADAAGMKVGRLMSLEEGAAVSVQPPRPMMMMKAAADSTPVSEGQLEISVPVSATFELQ